MTTSLATVLALIPISYSELARRIGISSKTIQRIKSWDYKPSQTTELIIVDYLDKLWLEIIKYIKQGDYAKQWFEMSDYPELYFY